MSLSTNELSRLSSWLRCNPVAGMETERKLLTEAVGWQHRLQHHFDAVGDKSMLNVNTRIGLPIVLENLKRFAQHENKANNLVAGSRIETACLLLENLENDKVWAVILNDAGELPRGSEALIKITAHSYMRKSSNPSSDAGCPTCGGGEKGSPRQGLLSQQQCKDDWHETDSGE